LEGGFQEETVLSMKTVPVNMPLQLGSSAPAASSVAPRVWPLALCAATASLLLYLCFFPVAWGTFLGWVALVPLLMLIRSPARPWKIYCIAYLAGCGFYFPVIQWMRVADDRMYFTWIGLSLYCSLYFPLALWMVRFIERRTALPLVLLFPLVWVPLEFCRAHLCGGFPWYMLGYTQQNFLPLIQIADIAGVHGLSLLLAAVNVVVFEWLFTLPTVRSWVGAGDERVSSRVSLVVQSAALLLAFTAVFAYGSWRLGQDQFTSGPRIALVQGNVPQQIRIDRNNPDEATREGAQETLFQHYEKLGDLATVQEPRPNMIVWPETSWPDDWTERTDGKKTEHARLISVFFAKRWQTHVLMGMNAQMWEEGRDKPLKRWNSAVLIGPDSEYLGRYDKIHRVPFGEYVPLKDSLPFMNQLAPYDFDYSVAAGEKQTRLPLGKHRFGVVICYEDTDPQLAREYVNPSAGEKVDFVLNISNDGWFDGTAEHEEHLAICRFRAIESRRSVARSVNMGISGIIDPNGRVLAPQKSERVLPPLRTAEEDKVWLWQVDPELGPTQELPVERWGEFKKVQGVMVAVVPIDNRSSFYAEYGDWLVWLCIAWTMGLMVYGGVRRKPT